MLRAPVIKKSEAMHNLGTICVIPSPFQESFVTLCWQDWYPDDVPRLRLERRETACTITSMVQLQRPRKSSSHKIVNRKNTKVKFICHKCMFESNVVAILSFCCCSNSRNSEQFWSPYINIVVYCTTHLIYIIYCNIYAFKGKSLKKTQKGFL